VANGLLAYNDRLFICNPDHNNVLFVSKSAVRMHFDADEMMLSKLCDLNKSIDLAAIGDTLFILQGGKDEDTSVGYLDLSCMKQPSQCTVKQLAKEQLAGCKDAASMDSVGPGAGKNDHTKASLFITCGRWPGSVVQVGLTLSDDKPVTPSVDSNTTYSGGGSTAYFYGPSGIASASDGTVYVAMSKSDSMIVMRPQSDYMPEQFSFTIPRHFGLPISDLTVNQKTGQIYALGQSTRNVFVIEPSGASRTLLENRAVSSGAKGHGQLLLEDVHGMGLDCAGAGGPYLYPCTVYFATSEGATGGTIAQAGHTIDPKPNARACHCVGKGPTPPTPTPKPTTPTPNPGPTPKPGPTKPPTKKKPQKRKPVHVLQLALLGAILGCGLVGVCVVQIKRSGSSEAGNALPALTKIKDKMSLLYTRSSLSSSRSSLSSSSSRGSSHDAAAAQEQLEERLIPTGAMVERNSNGRNSQHFRTHSTLEAVGQLQVSSFEALRGHRIVPSFGHAQAACTNATIPPPMR
jgi:hypothetical protein